MADANFFSPNTPIDPRKTLQYAQQQALAKAMMDEGNAPTDVSKYQIGGVAFAASPLEGLAKALKSGVGAYQSKSLQEDYAKDVGAYQSALANALKGGDLQSMIAASADNPMLAEFGKDLALSKAKSDYEVQKLMAIEGMKIQLDPEKRFINGMLGGGQRQPIQSQPLPPPQSQPMLGGSQEPQSLPVLPPNAALGSAVDANGVPSAFVPSDIQNGVNNSIAGKSMNAPPPVNDVESAMLEKYLGKPRDGMMWTTQNGQPAQVPNTNAKLDDNQSKAAGFYERMVESDPIISTNASAGMNPENVAKGSVPLVGNMMVPPEFQQFDQARRNFVNAVLRRESGAVISPSEFDNANKQYFPQPGDGPEVLAQKAQNRQTAMQGILQAAGPSYKPKPQPMPANGPLKINSDDDYNKLPSGTHFIAPDGSQRVKP